MNSELGKNLQVYTKTEASVKVEYATGSESWDYESSNAKITVTTTDGKERIYYISYGKSDQSCNIRGISSTKNTLKKVYMEYDEINIIGSEAELGEDNSLEIKTNPGYKAVYSHSDEDYEDKITVTRESDGSETVYYVYYQQDISGADTYTVSGLEDANADAQISSLSEEDFNRNAVDAAEPVNIPSGTDTDENMANEVLDSENLVGPQTTDVTVSEDMSPEGNLVLTE